MEHEPHGRSQAPSEGVPVRSFANRPLAELARAFLQDHGLAAAVDADDGNGTQPEVGFVTGGARLVVLPEDVDRARTLLDEVAAAGGAPTRRTHAPAARWTAAVVAGTMLLLGVWTTVVLLLF